MKKMMKVELLEIGGLRAVVEGLRLPYSKKQPKGKENLFFIASDGDNYFAGAHFTEKDLRLIRNLVKSGEDHAKVMRFLKFYLKISAPRYWWQEFDTYKVGVEKISESTMHTLLKWFQNKVKSKNSDLGLEEFLSKFMPEDNSEKTYLKRLFEEFYTIADRFEYGLLEKEEVIRKMKRLLPESFIQIKVVEVNWQTLFRIERQRKGHLLKEWQEFIEQINDIKWYKIFKPE